MSANLTARQNFSPSCPAGGTWWACGYGTYFVGCCARDPCEISCAQGNLYPGAFDPNAYGTFPDATCGTGSKFYTCTAGETFWGCCKTNACAQSGCPDGDLEAAILNRDDLLSAYHATGGSTTVSSAPSTSIPSAPAASSVTASPKSNDATPIGAIAGGAAGGAFALVAVIGIIVWCLCVRKKKKAKANAHYGETGADMLPVNGVTEFHQKHHRNQSSESPPSYTSPNPNYTNGFYNPHSQAHQYPHPSHLNYAQNTPQPEDTYHSPLPHTPQDTSMALLHNTSAAHYYNAPQELPLSSPSLPGTPAQFRNHKSMYGHARGPSELSGDQPRNELDSAELVSPELSGSAGARKWSWDDNKEKVELVQQQQQQQDAGSPARSDIGVAIGEPGGSPLRQQQQQQQWQEHHVSERQGDAKSGERLQWMASRGRDMEDGEEEENGKKRRGQRDSRARAPQGLGLLDLLDNAAERKGDMDAQRAEMHRR